MNQKKVQNIFKSILIGAASGSILIAAPENKKENYFAQKELEKNKNSEICKTNIQFFETHDCAAKNVCKGLGGCKVTEEQLIKQALRMGLDIKDRKKIGVPHGCYGLNECKGLGGCRVTEKKFKMMKRREKYYNRKRKVLLIRYNNSKNQKNNSSSSASSSSSAGITNQ